jgi:4-amino-4-deoxy-L-arabinose transferase-like glycosyltransferase
VIARGWSEAIAPTATAADSRPTRGELWALAGILLGAAGLRLAGSRYGLPEPLLNPDEANIVPRAWDLVHGGGLDPGWYDYPSLLMLLLAPTQVLAAEPSFGAARVGALAIGLLSVAAVWWLGRVAYGPRAGIVGAAAVAVATTHVAYSRMAVTDILLTLLVTVTLALLVTGRLEWAGVAAGLAASAKYPGVALLVPLVVASWGSWRRGARALALGCVAFAATSPFVLIHAGRAWGDISRVQNLARLGWLGLEDDPATPVAFLERLWEALGPVLLLSILCGLVALKRRSRTDVVLLSFVAAYWVELMPIEAHFDRYVLPLIAVFAVLAGSVRAFIPVAVVALVVPLVWSIGDAAALQGRDSRLVAQSWIAANVPPGDRIAVDPSLPSLSRLTVISLELPGPGRPFDGNRSIEKLRARHVRWVVTTGAIVDRLAARPDLYRRELAFYGDLDRGARLAFEADGDEPGFAGPWVRVYRLAR